MFSGLSVAFLNAGRLDNCYDFLQQVVPERPHVIGVLECRAGEFHAASFVHNLFRWGIGPGPFPTPPPEWL